MWESASKESSVIVFDRKTAYSYYRRLYPMPEASYRKLFEHFWSEYLKYRSVRRLDWDMRVQKNPGEEYHYNAAKKYWRAAILTDSRKAKIENRAKSLLERNNEFMSKNLGIPNPLPEAKESIGGNPGALRIATESEIAELVNLYHLARTALSGQKVGTYERMLWASKWFAKEHPEWSPSAAYKNLDRALSSNPIHPQAKEALARYKADLKAGHKGAAEYWRGQAGAYFTANPVYYHPAPLNTSTVYKEQFRNEWWVYSNGKKRWVTRKQAVDMLEKGAKFVMVRAYPWEASLVPTKHVLANPPVKVNPTAKADSTPMACQECGHRFLKKIGKSTIEVKCPKCGGYDTDLDYKARNPIGAIGTALVTGLGFGTGITMVDRMLKKGK